MIKLNLDLLVLVSSKNQEQNYKSEKFVNSFIKAVQFFLYKQSGYKQLALRW